MRRKNIDLNIIFYMLVIVIWALSYKFNIYSENQAFINFLSIIIAYLFINELYIKLVSRKGESGKLNKNKYLWPILWMSTLIIKELAISVIIALFFLSEITGVYDLKNKLRDKKIISIRLF